MPKHAPRCNSHDGHTDAGSAAISEVDTGAGSLKRMARPVCKGFVEDGMMVCINVSGWISAQSGPHKSAGAEHHI
jgi:hypothetical protein